MVDDSHADTFKFYAKCTFEEENLFEYEFNFELFENLEVLVIKKKSIKSDWATITNGLALIPSPKFRKMRIETGGLD